MDLREEFKKENGYGVMAVRQDYAGQRPYEDGFCDEYVEWLEAKVKKLTIPVVMQSCDTCKHLSTCRFWQEASNNGATCKFYIEHVA